MHRIQQFGPGSRRIHGWRRWTKGWRVAAIAAITLFGGLAGAAALRAVLPSSANEAPVASGVAEIAHNSDEAEHFDNHDNADRQDSHDADLRDDSTNLEIWATGDTWSNDLDALNRDLSRIESELGLNPQSKE